MIVGPNNRQLTRPIRRRHAHAAGAGDGGGRVDLDRRDREVGRDLDGLGWTDRQAAWLTCAVVAEHESAGDAVNAMKAMGVAA